MNYNSLINSKKFRKNNQYKKLFKMMLKKLEFKLIILA